MPVTKSQVLTSYIRGIKTERTLYSPSISTNTPLIWPFAIAEKAGVALGRPLYLSTQIRLSKD